MYYGIVGNNCSMVEASSGCVSGGRVASYVLYMNVDIYIYPHSEVWLPFLYTTSEALR